MPQRIIVTGTDTDVGKTVFAAALTRALDACYWKPVQAGLDADGASDSDGVARLANVASAQILPEVYRLVTPCSPHQAAEIDGVTIDPAKLSLPSVEGPLVIEGAGGVLTPLTRSLTFADMFSRWDCPVVLVARTALGTINHSLLSIEALRVRGIAILGIAFVGNANPESEAIIAEIGEVRRLGRLPMLAPLDQFTLADAFRENFDIGDFKS